LIEDPDEPVVTICKARRGPAVIRVYRSALPRG
jgi:hypothetical protein